MKNLLIIACLLVTSLGFAQDDVDVKGNTVTVREKAPVWPGCEAQDDKKACFNKQLMKHVREHYKYPRNEAGELVRGKSTISLQVNEKGNVEILSIKGDKEMVNEAARRMIDAIPQMTPGTRGGKATVIKYTIPLTL
ncbi:energy transducer TonB [Salegentibacter chungangensis]|uniref:Energy transducer TonB n=1 Tax=Salegentibacter chungangensis TaxID=1335724 RepID=A0ABW3NQ12_9FLAO